MIHLQETEEEELNRLLGIVVDVENLFVCVHKVRKKMVGGLIEMINADNFPVQSFLKHFLCSRKKIPRRSKFTSFSSSCCDGAS